jgi:hypothetical protein
LITSCDKANDPICRNVAVHRNRTTDGQVFNTIRTLTLSRKSYETYLVEREEANGFCNIH